MNVLCVSGFGEEVQDDSKFWGIADALDSTAAVDLVVRRQWDTLAPADVAAADVIIAYSYGQAALWHALAAFPPDQRPTIKHLFIIAGVPRFWWGQLYGTPWTIPANIQAATCFNIDSIPASCGIHNQCDRYVNISCRDRGLDHVSIQGDPIVRQTIIDAVRAMATEEAS
ncbi:MAG TPA: hypothetical protein VHQ47_17730 [Phycisphaerae bacterium]|jgi:hypothetical protein|nr:hypothetical protein [Phycisphaerae bacterium]